MAYVIDTDNLIPKMTSNTAPSGTAARSTRSSSTYDAWKAFDRVGTTYWSASTSTGWLSYAFTTLKTINQYNLYSRLSAPTSAPKNWTFEGYNGTSWVVLDTQTNVTGWADGVVKTFYFSNLMHYISYRMNITANNGHTNLCICELEMMQMGVIVNPNIICLLHFDGDLLDESGKTWTAHNGASTTTTESVFGGSSFNADGGYITIPKTSLGLASFSEFTIDFRINISSYTGNQKIFSDGDGQTTANESLYISTEGDPVTGVNRGLRLRTVGDGYDTNIFTETLSPNVFYHISVVYYNGLFALYVDGVFKSATTQVHTLQDGLAMWSIGATPVGIHPMINSYIDEFRIDDVARWTEDFAVPTEPYTMFTGTFFLPPLTCL